MRAAPAPILALSVLLAAPAAAPAADAPISDAPARVRPRPAHAPRQRAMAPTDTDRTLARWAEEDRLTGRPVWDPPRPLASHFPPATRQEIAAPPFTGWGYGATVPGAWPGF